MKKLNGLEAYWLNEGLKLVLEKATNEIEKVEDNGSNHIMTTGFITQEITQLQDKLIDMTLKKHQT